jgi:uncharacterized protein DUF5670
LRKRRRTVRLDVLKELGEETNFWIDGPRKFNSTERNTVLWTIIVILVVLWLLGFLGHVGGSLIHLLLVIAVVVLIITGSRQTRALSHFSKRFIFRRTAPRHGVWL